MPSCASTRNGERWRSLAAANLVSSSYGRLGSSEARAGRRARSSSEELAINDERLMIDGTWICRREHARSEELPSHAQMASTCAPEPPVMLLDTSDKNQTRRILITVCPCLATDNVYLNASHTSLRPHADSLLLQSDKTSPASPEGLGPKSLDGAMEKKRIVFLRAPNRGPERDTRRFSRSSSMNRHGIQSSG